jgi:isohexenylglutaconyl-CoA hydratase
MKLETIEIEDSGPVRTVWFNRPERRNAITQKMMAELTETFHSIAQNENIRVLVLRGRGGNFCAGGDLGHMRDLPKESSSDPTARAYRRMGEALEALNELPQAVVAAVEGACVGGGLGMACASDFVLCMANAKLGMPEARAGFIPSQILPTVVRRIGEGEARRLAVIAKVISGYEAHRIGIAHELTETSSDFEASLNNTLSNLAWAEPTAVAEIKRIIRLTSQAPMSEVLDDAASALSRLLRSDEAAEGIAAFQQKRPPRWATLKR